MLLYLMIPLALVAITIAIAPVLASLLGTSGALVTTGGAVLAYTLLILRAGAGRDEHRVPDTSDDTIVLARPAVADAVPAR